MRANYSSPELFGFYFQPIYHIFCKNYSHTPKVKTKEACLVF